VGHPLVLCTTEALQVVFLLITDMVVTLGAVAVPAPAVELSELTTLGVLRAVEGLGGCLAEFSLGVANVCRGRERLAPGVYEHAVGVVIAHVGCVLTHPRVLATPRLPGMIVWLVAVVVHKIRPEALVYANAEREHRRAAAEAARALVAMAGHGHGAQ